MMKVEINECEKFLKKWQDILRLRDWDIFIHIVETEWRKSGDIKIDADDRKAVLMINGFNPKQENLEALIIHELLHLERMKVIQSSSLLITSL